MTKSTEEQPAAVSAKTIRAREILRLIVQVEPKVWTERMLTALVQGVKGGKWFSLIDKVHPERTLARVSYLSSRRMHNHCRNNGLGQHFCIP